MGGATGHARTCRNLPVLQHAVADVAETLLHLLHALSQLLLQAGQRGTLAEPWLAVLLRTRACTSAACAAPALLGPAARVLLLLEGCSCCRCVPAVLLQHAIVAAPCTWRPLCGWCGACGAAAGPQRCCIHSCCSDLLLQQLQLCCQGL